MKNGLNSSSGYYYTTESEYSSWEVFSWKTGTYEPKRVKATSATYAQIAQDLEKRREESTSDSMVVVA